MSRNIKDVLLSFTIGVAFATVVALALVKKPQNYRSDVITSNQCIEAILRN